MLPITVLAATVAAVLAAGWPAAAAETVETRTRASLRLLDAAPVKVRGTAFRARERVRVVLLVADRRYVRRVRATSAGAFTVALAAVSAADPCTLEAWAVGGAGTRATLKLPQRMCPPPLAP